MKSSYRINVRFDLKKEAEKSAAEYLAALSEKSGGTRNRFIVNAVIEAIRREQNGTDISLDDIRAMLHEELQSVSFAKVPETRTPSFTMELSEEEKAENEANILETLKMFD